MKPWTSFKLDDENTERLRSCAKLLNKPVNRLLNELLREPLRLLLMAQAGDGQKAGQTR